MRGKPRLVNISSLRDAEQEISKIGSDKPGIKIMSNKAVLYPIKIDRVKGAVANVLKQEMLSKGGECSISRRALVEPQSEDDILLLGTVKQYKLLAAKLKAQEFGMPKIGQELLEVIKNLQGYEPFDLKCGSMTLPIGKRTLVMGILNVTPDSFSDGGKYVDIDKAVEHAQQMIAEGADIIDLGGESTRPGYTKIGPEEELRRLLPVLRRLVKTINVPISIDTYRAEVAKQTAANGATMINDIWGLRYDPDMAKVVADAGIPYIMMHNQDGTEYGDLMGDMMDFFIEGLAMAEAAGIKRENIILDPGIGFGKTVEQNIETMGRLGELRGLGLPLLLGTSRKSLIAKTLNLPPNERLEGTAATVALSIAYCGAEIIRVHDVKEIARVCTMTDAIVRRTRI